MTIKVILKNTRIDSSVNWYNFRGDGEYSRDAAKSEISSRENDSNPEILTDVSIPDDLTLIVTHTWPDLDTYNDQIGDYDASSNSDWKSFADACGTYEASNNITCIRYIYDADNNLTSTQKKVNKVYWEDYSE